MTKALTSRKGFSLMEVLVATGIIAVALYGLVMASASETLAENKSRQDRYISSLHAQLLEEILGGYRKPEEIDGTILVNTGLDVSLSYSEKLDTGTNVLTSTLSWTTLLGNTHSETFYVFYKE
jgi:prepilin-type N-terminal cleavage/methylation domain-containing protein